jgi:hypothetical protein
MKNTFFTLIFNLNLNFKDNKKKQNLIKFEIVLISEKIPNKKLNKTKFYRKQKLLNSIFTNLENYRIRLHSRMNRLRFKL